MKKEGKKKAEKEREYNCSCQDTVTFASYTGHSRLMSKTNCAAKLLRASADFWRMQRYTGDLNAHSTAWVSQELEGTQYSRSHEL